MRKTMYNFCGFLGLCLTSINVFCQVTISGPACTVSGVPYEYTINGHWDASSTMQVCVDNGLIQDPTGNNACSPSGSPRNAVLVLWNDSSSNNGTITITSSAGNASLNVNFVKLLTPGTIDSASKVQVINYGSVPAAINCTQDSGSSCSPVFIYQWQKSSDIVSWQNMPGANSKVLTIDSAMTQTCYFRRKVTETVSGSIGYSDAASVFVIVMPTDSSRNSEDSSQGSSGVRLQESNEIKGVTQTGEAGIKIHYGWLLKDREVIGWQIANKHNIKA